MRRRSKAYSKREKVEYVRANYKDMRVVDMAKHLECTEEGVRYIMRKELLFKPLMNTKGKIPHKIIPAGHGRVMECFHFDDDTRRHVDLLKKVYGTYGGDHA